MNQLKSIFGVLILLVGGYVLYEVLPFYWDNYKLGRLIEAQAVVYTYTSRSNAEIAADIAKKARQFDIVLTPEQVKVRRTAANLTITAEYSVHVDLPFYPLDLNLKAESKNNDIMVK
jgi:hypothetical protein